MNNTDCGMLMKQICDRLEKNANNELRNQDLTLSQIRYLTFLYENKDKNIELKELESYFEVSQPTVAGIINRLESKDLVKMQQSPKKISAKIVNITESGIKVCNECNQHQHITEDVLLNNFTELEKKQLKDLLLRVFENIK